MRGQAEQVERIPDNLENSLLCRFLFSWAFFKTNILLILKYNNVEA